MKKTLITSTALAIAGFVLAILTAATPANESGFGKRYPELNQTITGRPFPIGTTPTSVHELSKNDHDVLMLEFFNSDSVARWAQIAYNGWGVKVLVPAGDSKKVGPFALAGRASDGTAVANKNVILDAEANDVIRVMGEVR